MEILSASPTLAGVPIQKPDRCHELTGNRKGEFAVDLIHPFRLTFMPNHSPVPKKGDGGIDLDQVTAITINGVEDYH
jgi:proteic killer suppression protein